MKLIAFLVAIAGAELLNMGHPPSVTMLNQLLAICGWGLVMIVAPAPALRASTWRGVAPLLAVFALAASGCAASILAGGFPSTPGVGVLGIIALGAAVALHGASAGANEPAGYFRAFAIALVVGGLCNAVIGIAQVFAVDSLDNVIIATPIRTGRAGGNIGQPNHFADMMLWGLVALVPLVTAWRSSARARLAWVGGGVAAVVMLLGVVLAGSRTAMVALGLMSLWGLADRNLARRLRIALALALPLGWVAQRLVALLAHARGLEVVLTDRSDVGVTAFRAEIWGNALTLIKEQPLLGVGWGQFNFAWTLTPFSERGAGLVTNAHNLPLQLAVELGVPVALLMMGLLFWALWKALTRVWRLAGDAGVAARSTLMIVVVVGLHSMLEYPLWYAYLLLPTAWAFGLALGTATKMSTAQVDAPEPAAGAAAPLRAWRALGLMMVVLAVSAWVDYRNIVALFVPSGTTLTMAERIQSARVSPLFANEGDYVAAVNSPLTPAILPAVVRSSHVLLNGRLMYAWANLLNNQGQVDKARYMAARLREFDLPGPRPWFAPCSDPAVTVKPFQCLAPEHPVSWRDFR
jgi:O-antigen ligase